MKANKFNILTALTAGGLIMGASSLHAQSAKNVILMISDGQGFNTVKATDIYTGTQAVYEGSDFVKYSMNTSSAGARGGYVGAAYNPSGMWNSPTYALSGYTDSASAATAMYTGVKNYDNEVNWSTSGQALTTFFESAGLAGKSVGAVTSVEFSHATPAAVLAHNSSRNNYAAIANETMSNSALKVLMGAGHPMFNDNGGAASTPNYNFVGGQTTWTDMADGSYNGFTVIDTKTQFGNLASGALSADKVIGVAQAATTLQQGRSGAPAANAQVGPNVGTQNTNVPTLETMTLGALNTIDNNANGFALMIEGGAIDWANHAETLGRMIEEQIDFNASVAAVSSYLDNNTNGNNWSNTLLIVTADHECGGLWGANTYVDANNNKRYDTGDTFNGFQQISDANSDGLAEFQFMSSNHTNALVPLYAKGFGSELFANYKLGTDDQLATMYGVDAAFNNYIDNIAVFNVMSLSAIPEPGSMLALCGLVGSGVFLRSRRRR